MKKKTVTSVRTESAPGEQSERIAERGTAALKPHRLDTSIQFHVSNLANRYSLHLASHYKPRHGLSVAAWRVLAVLAEDAPLSAKQVAERTVMDPIKITRAVTQLSDLGLVSRRVDPKDRRRIALRLSAKGVEVYDDMLPFVSDAYAGLYAVLTTSEQNVLRAMLIKLEMRSIEIFGSIPNVDSGADVDP